MPQGYRKQTQKCDVLLSFQFANKNNNMNNIYKPSYSRGQKRSAIPSRESVGRKNIGLKGKNQLLDFDNPPLITNRRNASTAQNLQDSSDDLLFVNHIVQKKTPLNRLAYTSKQASRNGIQRPQSKQSSRARDWNQSGLFLKGATNDMNNRPQTSKGQRPKQYYREKVEDLSKRRNSLQNDSLKVDKRMLEAKPMSSVGTRKGSQTSRIEFKTSIDPEFLSLFAS